VDRSSPQAVSTLVSALRVGLTAGRLLDDGWRKVAGLLRSIGVRVLPVLASADQTTTARIWTIDVFVVASTTAARPKVTPLLALGGLLPSPTATTTLLGRVLADDRRAHLTVPHFSAPRDTRRAARTVPRGGALRGARQTARTVLRGCVLLVARWAVRTAPVV